MSNPNNQCMNYPRTQKVDQVDDYHGVAVADPYRWLEDDHAAETLAWVSEQNEVTAAYLATIDERDRYRERLVEMYSSPRYSAPRVIGGKTFYTRNDGLQNQGVFYFDDEAGTARLLLDPNELSADGTVAVVEMAITADAALAAYALSSSGSDWQEIRVRTVGGDEHADRLAFVKFSPIAWTLDNAGFFYSRYPEPAAGSELSGRNGNHAIYYHRLGTDQSADVLIHERPDMPDWLLFARVTDDGRYLVVVAHYGGRDRLAVADMADPLAPRLDAPIRDLIGDFDADYECFANDGDTFYVLTNLDAPCGCVLAVKHAAPPRAVVPEADDVLEAAGMLGDRFVLTYLHDAYNRILLVDRDGAQRSEVTLPTFGSVFLSEARREDTAIFYTFTSFLYPNAIFRYDIITGEHTAYRPSDMAIDASRYETSQVWCTSADGTAVPMFVTRRRDLPLDGTSPTIMYAYGGFGSSQTPFFTRWGLLWMEEGGTFVVVNARGGGEFGESWHSDATRAAKQKTFDDLIAAAEHLIAAGVASPPTLALMGASNGGLAVCAVMCQRPELFAVMLPQVAVTDMLRYQHFTIGRAWQGEYGLSEDAAMFPVLYAYSPLHNLREGVHYPATLVATSDHDDRVVPAHSFKFLARLQACQGGDAPVLMRVSMGAGHGLGKPISMIIDESADTLAFARRNMRTTDDPGSPFIPNSKSLT